MNRIVIIFLISICSLIIISSCSMKGARNQNLVNDNINNTSDISRDTKYSVSYPNVERYFNDNSSIVSVIRVQDSDNTLSESDAMQLFKDRGFTGYPVTTEYSINGEFNEATEIISSSSSKHPIYQSFYVNSSNELWTILVIDGVIMASPITFNIQHSDHVPVVVSESKEIVSYDSSTNSFYRTIPNESIMDVRIYSQIDSSLLDSLTVEVLINA